MTSLETRARLFASLLAGLAGYVDAIGFIRTGGFFVSFMSGNSTRLGVGLATVMQQALIAGGIVLCFVAGVVAGSLLGHAAAARRAPVVLGLVALLLAAASLAGAAAVPAIALMAIAMGAENAVFERDGNVRFGVTYMTGSLVRVGNGLCSLLLGRGGNGWAFHLLLWLGFVIGTVAGAIAQSASPALCLWAASIGAALLALASTRLVR